MARRLRIKDCAYHHIYNRGVAQNNIFKNDKDKDKFIEILDERSKEYKFNIHSFCLIDNYYHLLKNKKRIFCGKIDINLGLE